MSKTSEASSRVDHRVIAWYLAVLKAGAVVGEWRDRDLWDLGMQGIGKATSSRALRTHTKAAERMGLIEVERGAGRKQGRVRLLEPGHPDQFIPDLVEAGLTGEALRVVIDDGVDVETVLRGGLDAVEDEGDQDPGDEDG